MSDRGRVVGIVAAVALAAGGAGFYYFKIYEPGQNLKAAQAEIVEWETRYQEARDCLLGKSPGSAKTSEALAIREMAPDPWDRGKCTPLVSKLTRSVGTDTGVEAVESAWNNVDKAAQAAASAFANHVAGIAGDGPGQDPLPVALDALDAARGKLRAAAELPSAQSAGASLPPAQIVALANIDPGAMLFFDMPSAHGVLAQAQNRDVRTQVQFAPGEAPRVGGVDALGVRAVPDLSWGAIGELLVVQGTGNAQTSAGTVKVGTMDAQGAIATPQSVPVSVPLPPPAPQQPRAKPGDDGGAAIPGFAVGSLADGALTYSAGQAMVIARAKGNAVTPDKPITVEAATRSVDVDGRAVVLWSTHDNVHRALLFRKGGEDTFELPTTFKGMPCLTNDRVWMPAVEPQMIAFGGGKPLERIEIPPDAVLQGCTADAAILRSYQRHRDVTICTDRCRSAPIPSGAPEYATITAVGGKLRAIAAHAGVLGVWSEDKPPVFYAMPERAMPVDQSGDPVMALTNGKLIDVIARGEKSYVLIRLPAT
jgi:hypothetical protein